MLPSKLRLFDGINQKESDKTVTNLKSQPKSKSKSKPKVNIIDREEKEEKETDSVKKEKDKEKMKIMASLRDILNKKGYQKDNLDSIPKEEAKIMIKELIAIHKSIECLRLSKSSSIWKEPYEEIMNENQAKGQQHQRENKTHTTNLINHNETNRDTKRNCEDDSLEKVNYDDLIQAEFPTEYNEEVHDKRITQLVNQLTAQRQNEVDLRNAFQTQVKNLESGKDDNHKNMNNQVKVLSEEEKKKKIENEKKKLKFKLKTDIKNNTFMKNDEFLLLLCLMRKKKEKMMENNPYIVDYAVTLNSVYQSDTKIVDDDNYIDALYDEDQRE